VHATLGVVWTYEVADDDGPAEMGCIVARSGEDGRVLWRSEPGERQMIRIILDGHIIIQREKTLECWRSVDPDNPIAKPRRVSIKPKPKPQKPKPNVF